MREDKIVNQILNGQGGNCATMRGAKCPCSFIFPHKIPKVVISYDSQWENVHSFITNGSKPVCHSDLVMILSHNLIRRVLRSQRSLRTRNA